MGYQSSLITRDQSQRALINRLNFQIQLDQYQSVSFDQSSRNSVIQKTEFSPNHLGPNDSLILLYNKLLEIHKMDEQRNINPT